MITSTSTLAVLFAAAKVLLTLAIDELECLSPVRMKLGAGVSRRFALKFARMA
jgi:hypothetical protein